mmetsp:Transcript_81345/g.128081  ORF Transcript_81345/g.128081 Transcript_81345/m.128081 type:complete len:318 (-) Transcript_81345:4796-5749(-)
MLPTGKEASGVVVDAIVVVVDAGASVDIIVVGVNAWGGMWTGEGASEELSESERAGDGGSNGASICWFAIACIITGSCGWPGSSGGGAPRAFEPCRLGRSPKNDNFGTAFAFAPPSEGTGGGKVLCNGCCACGICCGTGGACIGSGICGSMPGSSGGGAPKPPVPCKLGRTPLNESLGTAFLPPGIGGIMAGALICDACVEPSGAGGAASLASSSELSSELSRPSGLPDGLLTCGKGRCSMLGVVCHEATTGKPSDACDAEEVTGGGAPARKRPLPKRPLPSGWCAKDKPSNSWFGLDAQLPGVEFVAALTRDRFFC